MFLGRGCDCTKPRQGQKCRAEYLQGRSWFECEEGQPGRGYSELGTCSSAPSCLGGLKRCFAGLQLHKRERDPCGMFSGQGEQGRCHMGQTVSQLALGSCTFQEPFLSSASSMALVFCLRFYCTQSLLKQCPGKEGSCGICVLWHWPLLGYSEWRGGELGAAAPADVDGGGCLPKSVSRKGRITPRTIRCSGSQV